MNDLNDGIKHSIIKFADNMKPERCMRTVEDSTKSQNLSKKIEDTNKIQFSEGKCHTLYLCRNHQMHKYNMGNT